MPKVGELELETFLVRSQAWSWVVTALEVAVFAAGAALWRLWRRRRAARALGELPTLPAFMPSAAELAEVTGWQREGLPGMPPYDPDLTIQIAPWGASCARKRPLWASSPPARARRSVR